MTVWIVTETWEGSFRGVFTTEDAVRRHFADETWTRRANGTLTNGTIEHDEDGECVVNEDMRAVRVAVRS